MYTLSCSDIGIKKCDFVASEEIIHDVLEKMVRHIEKNHLKEWGRTESGMDIEAEHDFLVKHIKEENGSPI